MPELPEVETVVRGLRPPLIGRTIKEVSCDWPRLIAMPDLPHFAARIAGQSVGSIHRRAKYLVFTLTDDVFILHLRMTGRAYVVPRASQHEADRWVHLTLGLDNEHEFRFSDARKFGRAYLVTDPDTVLGELGPEPLSDAFTVEAFAARIAPRRGMLKPLLLNQRFLAGMGNIYVDEALHRAAIHPQRSAGGLTETEITRLRHAIRETLQEGIAHEGASIDWYRKPDGTKGQAQNGLRVYGRAGQPCLGCGHPIRRIVVGQRGTYLCDACQPRKEHG